MYKREGNLILNRDGEKIYDLEESFEIRNPNKIKKQAEDIELNGGEYEKIDGTIINLEDLPPFEIFYTIRDDLILRREVEKEKFMNNLCDKIVEQRKEEIRNRGLTLGDVTRGGKQDIDDKEDEDNELEKAIELIEYQEEYKTKNILFNVIVRGIMFYLLIEISRVIYEITLFNSKTYKPLTEQARWSRFILILSIITASFFMSLLEILKILIQNYKTKGMEGRRK